MAHSTKNSEKIAFFAILVGLVVFDIIFDFSHGMQIKHLIVEVIVLFMALIGLNYFISINSKASKKKARELAQLSSDLGQQKAEVTELKNQVKSYKNEIRSDIQTTFKKWKLTQAERDVSVLLLKGMALKEIAEIRKSNERTVRAQCSSVYKKSKLKGRSQFSSYFLDGII